MRAQEPRGPNLVSWGSVSVRLDGERGLTYGFSWENEQAQQDSDCTEDGKGNSEDACEEEGVYRGLNEGRVGVDVHAE